MNKAGLVEKVRETGDFTWKESHSAVDAVFTVISNTLQAGDVVSVTGFGKFTPRTRPARTMKNPLDGNMIDVPERKGVTFKAGKSLKDTVNS